MTRAVALLSGGLDSGVALATWRERGGEVALALTADYGQRAAAEEMRAARTLADRFGVAWRPLPLPWLGDAARHAGSALVDADGELPLQSVEDPGDEQSAAAVWVPARNLVLIAAAAAHAEAWRADAIVVGFNREEAETFPDNSASFVRSLESALADGARRSMKIASPTQAWTKREIVAEARQLGLARCDFWSCYAAGPEPCGVCESCARSDRAWQAEG